MGDAGGWRWGKGDGDAQKPKTAEAAQRFWNGSSKLVVDQNPGHKKGNEWDGTGIFYITLDFSLG